ncbi:cyclic nucleotide-binding domain-containing protein [Teredinibacter sp. KSP-S5-2]|uniref:cyclic nucleotide-binding domain-containing protein n=1 Tax=Teredinibacter sp. KSP-S5-2 TaxID=3034506 RepID=UPI0029349545|nr:cyclic nucleotide-binding domain-containing protein [Teredinibacter sp. KSP-S5-2]WNO10149.1 cyclic nucleotide-binding domain-containing protein [Teredinibacter sp. KSP-S5-2]
MEVHPLSRYPQATLDNLLASIPFYKTVQQTDQYQYDLLMRYSRVSEFRPGEVLMEQGQNDQWLYFLLKGQLAVLVGDTKAERKVVNYLTPGEVFGDLAVLVDHQRTATVIADSNCKRVLVFGTDFTVFGELTDISKISLFTKLVYYRNMVHNLRWKLEVYRMSYPEHSFASNHRKVKLYIGKKDTLEELISLDEQARALARLLVQWNLEFDRLAISPRDKLDYTTLAAIG